MHGPWHCTFLNRVQKTLRCTFFDLFYFSCTFLHVLLHVFARFCMFLHVPCIFSLKLSITYSFFHFKAKNHLNFAYTRLITHWSYAFRYHHNEVTSSLKGQFHFLFPTFSWVFQVCSFVTWLIHSMKMQVHKNSSNSLKKKDLTPLCTLNILLSPCSKNTFLWLFYKWCIFINN